MINSFFAFFSHQYHLKQPSVFLTFNTPTICLSIMILYHDTTRYVTQWLKGTHFSVPTQGLRVTS